MSDLKLNLLLCAIELERDFTGRYFALEFANEWQGYRARAWAFESEAGARGPVQVAGADWARGVKLGLTRGGAGQTYTSSRVEIQG